MKLKKLFRQWRIWVFIIFLLISFISINHQFGEPAIAVSAVEQNSTAYESGLRTPSGETPPTKREIIFLVNNMEVKSLDEFNNIINSIQTGSVITIVTTKQSYSLIKESDEIGITVTEAARSNIRKGLDLQGGTRVLLSPEEKITDSQVNDIISVMGSRLNIYGLSDVTVKSAADLEGNKFIVVEIAGVSKEEIKNLLENQGKFEARISDNIVFEGGKKDITFVCRTDATCSRIITPCPKSGNDYVCRFEFEIALSPDAAERHASVTENLATGPSGSGGRVLNETIDFYLDNVLIDELQIDASLKGQRATRIVISGPGAGITQEEALQNAIKNRDRLQTVLITGSLPSKLSIEKIDSISPSLGEAFVDNALLVGLLAVIAVGIVISIRYKKIKVTVPIMITVVSEIYIILGFAALFKQNLDLAAIAAIIAAVGTGVDHQIVIADEMLRGKSGSTKESAKRAFFVIFVAYAATVAAMIPLLRAGAGLLTGFAVITIVGASIGVLITRPAFASAMRVLLED